MAPALSTSLPSTPVPPADELTKAAAELDCIRARLIVWRNQYPNLDPNDGIGFAIAAVNAQTRNLMGAALVVCGSPRPEVAGYIGGAGCEESSLPACPCGCGALPLAVVGQGDHIVSIHEHGATGECVAGSCCCNTAGSVGKSGALDRRVVQPASHEATAPGGGARTSSPGLFRNLLRWLLDAIS